MSKSRIYQTLLGLCIIMGSVFIYQHFVLRRMEFNFWDVLNMLVSAITLFLCGRELIQSNFFVKLGYVSMILCGCAGSAAVVCFVLWV